MTDERARRNPIEILLVILRSKLFEMIEKKPVATHHTHPGHTKQPAKNNPAVRTGPVAHAPGNSGFFSKDNYIWMLAGIIVIAIGMFLMSGGKSSSPNEFDQKQVYSTTRITIAPLLILIGLGLEVFAIFRTPKA